MKKIVLSLVIIIAIALIPQTQASATEQYIGYCEEIGAKYCISPELLQAIIEHESTYNPNATNGNCKGLMQIYEKYHTDRMNRLGVTDIYDPYSNILVGADIINELHMKYGDDVYLVLMEYNGVSNAYSKWERGEINEYAKRVVNRAYELESVNGKHEY